MTEPTRRPALRLGGCLRSYSAALACVLLVGACTGQERSDRADLARSALLGLSASELDSCAGAPDAVRLSQGVEFRTYSTGVVDRAYQGPTATHLGNDGLFGRGTRVGVSSGVSLPGEISSSYCETIITLVNGRVSQIDYRSSTGIRIGDFGTRYAECERIVAGCLAQVERRVGRERPIEDVTSDDAPVAQ